MTELTEILSATPSSMRGCRFDSWYKQLSKEEQQSVRDAMANPDWPSTKLTQIFKKFGMTSDEKTVRLHRKKECSICGPV